MEDKLVIRTPEDVDLLRPWVEKRTYDALLIHNTYSPEDGTTTLTFMLKDKDAHAGVVVVPDAAVLHKNLLQLIHLELKP